MSNFDPYNENFAATYIAFVSYCAQYQAQAIRLASIEKHTIRKAGNLRG